MALFVVLLCCYVVVMLCCVFVIMELTCKLFVVAASRFSLSYDVFVQYILLFCDVFWLLVLSEVPMERNWVRVCK